MPTPRPRHAAIFAITLAIIPQPHPTAQDANHADDDILDKMVEPAALAVLVGYANHERLTQSHIRGAGSTILSSERSPPATRPECGSPAGAGVAAAVSSAAGVPMSIQADLAAALDSFDVTAIPTFTNSSVAGGIDILRAAIDRRLTARVAQWMARMENPHKEEQGQ